MYFVINIKPRAISLVEIILITLFSDYPTVEHSVAEVVSALLVFRVCLLDLF